MNRIRCMDHRRMGRAVRRGRCAKHARELRTRGGLGFEFGISREEKVEANKAWDPRGQTIVMGKMLGSGRSFYRIEGPVVPFSDYLGTLNPERPMSGEEAKKIMAEIKAMMNEGKVSLSHDHKPEDFRGTTDFGKLADEVPVARCYFHRND